MKTFLLAVIIALFALLSLGCHCDEIDCYGGPERRYTVTTPDRTFPWRHVTRPINFTGQYLTFITEDGRSVAIEGKYTIEEEKKEVQK